MAVYGSGQGAGGGVEEEGESLTLDSAQSGIRSFLTLGCH